MEKILIVEDDALLRSALHEKFMHEGYEALMATDGEEGLEIALKEHPYAIILDIIMPKMDGIHMMEALRKDEWGKDVPIIFLTNVNPTDVTIQKILNSPPAYYIIKINVKIGEVVKKVEDALKIIGERLR